MTASVPIVAIDVGNSSIKLGEFRELTPGSFPADPVRVLRLSAESPDWGQLAAWLGHQSTVAYLISVSPPVASRLTAWLAEHRPSCQLRLLRQQDFPLEVRVFHPERVGLDRLAGAVAAGQIKAADRAAIVVDAGTAITVDVVSPDGAFLGGAILPGWTTLARSLCVGTQLLPMVDVGLPVVPPPVVGRSTEEAITSGVYWGSVGAVRELVQRMAAPWDPLPDRILAGGDLQTLNVHFDSQARCFPNLVLQGIVYAAVTGRRA